jgi:hypothetical protein
MSRRILYLMLLNTFLPVLLFLLVYKWPEWDYFGYRRSSLLQALWESDGLLNWMKLWSGLINIALLMLYLVFRKREPAEQKGKLWPAIVLTLLSWWYFFVSIVMIIYFLLNVGKIGG